jgi:rhodanese-related sulfurtransferase
MVPPAVRIARISPEELKAKLDHTDSVLVVDLRHALDVQGEPTGIPGAVHMDPSELEAPQAALPRDREVVLYCS